MLSDWKQSTFCSVNFQLQSQNCGKERVLRWCPLNSCRQSHPAATTAGMLYLYAFPVSSGSGRKVICLAFTLFYIFPSVFWASTQPLVLPTPIRLPFTPGLSRTARWSHNLLSTSWSTSLLSILGFLWKNSLLNLPIMKSSPWSKQWIDLWRFWKVWRSGGCCLLIRSQGWPSARRVSGCQARSSRPASPDWRGSAPGSARSPSNQGDPDIEIATAAEIQRWLPSRADRRDPASASGGD